MKSIHIQLNHKVVTCLIKLLTFLCLKYFGRIIYSNIYGSFFGWDIEAANFSSYHYQINYYYAVVILNIYSELVDMGDILPDYSADKFLNDITLI
jgi:hypothetical protein